MPIIHDLSMPEYLAIDALSSGAAFRAVTQSPLHARHYQLAPSDNSKVADIGSIAHQILLEGCEDCVVLVDADSWRTKDAQTARDDARAVGKSPILAHQIHDIRAMVESAKAFVKTTELGGLSKIRITKCPDKTLWYAKRVGETFDVRHEQDIFYDVVDPIDSKRSSVFKDDAEVLGFFDTGKPEVTINWDDNGIFCKARPDYLSADWHISVKTTSASANPAVFSRRSLSALGYDFGLEFYRRGLLANGIDVKHRILIIEQQEPYGCSLISLAPNKKASCRIYVERAIKLWKECSSTGVFSGYPSETAEIEATPWEIAEAEAILYA